AGDEKIQVIDLKLKDEAKKGYFGKASFGTDFSRFYEGQVLANKFNKKQKISVYFMSSNTTKSTLSWKDANDFGIDNATQYKYNSETDSWEVNDNFISTEDGFPLMFKSGFYYTDQINSKLKVGANYTYSDFRKRTESNTNVSFFMPDTTFSTSMIDKETNQYRSHEANLNIEYKIDSTQTLTFEPKFIFAEKTSETNSTSSYKDANASSVRNSINQQMGESDVTNIKARLAYNKKFKKEKRELKITNNVVVDNSNSETQIGFKDQMLLTNTIENEIDQNKLNDRNIFSNVFSTVFIEPINKKMKFEFVYELFNIKNSQNTQSFNKFNGEYTLLDSLTSGDFTSIKTQNRVGVSWIYDYKKHLVTIGAMGRTVQINNNNLFDNTSIRQSVTNVLPKIVHYYRIGRNTSWRSSITSNSVLPSIQLLQPVRNNSNPNSIFIGNSNLKPNYTFNLNSNFNHYNPLNGGYVYAGIYASYGLNEFISSITYDNLGRRTQTYVNENSLNYAGLWAGGGIPIIKQILNLTPHLQYNQGNRVNYVDDIRNTLNTYTVSPNIDINLYTDIVEFSFGFDYSFTKNQNSISSNLNLTNNRYGLNSDIRIYLPWKMELATDFEYNQYRNLAEGFNINTFIWNAEIEQNFGKNDNFSIALKAYDMLNQNTKIIRESSANQIYDTRKTIIARYFLFSLTYKFNSTFKKSKKTENNEITE
ncbi:MAG TPA: outer membrane beta-barrel protein, partial [Taishania sp.]|nr:outer membrane beta-barrel protein [Taishania sp.]